MSCLGYGFFYLADEVGEGSTAALDRKILLGLRNPADLSDPIGPRWLEETMRDITGLGSVFTITFVTLSAVAYLATTRRHRIAVFVLGAIGGGLLVSTVLKMFYHRPRPDLVPHGMDVFTASFPSGHAMMSAIAYLTLAPLLARVDPNRSVKVLVPHRRCRDDAPGRRQPDLSRRSLAERRARRLVHRRGMGLALLVRRAHSPAQGRGRGPRSASRMTAFRALTRRTTAWRIAAHRSPDLWSRA